LALGFSVVENSARQTIREFIIRTFLFGNPPPGFQDGDSFSAKGIVDSAGVLAVIVFLEEAFALQVLDEDVVPDNFDSVDRLTAYVQRKTEGLR
jgi:acyl carrier protein